MNREAVFPWGKSLFFYMGVLLAVWCGRAMADVPSNDRCIQAIEILEGVEQQGELGEATGLLTTSCGRGQDTNDIWFYFDPPQNGTYKVSLCGSDFDTTLALYNSCVSTEPLICNDDHCQLQSELIYDMNSASRYYIRVAGYDDESGTYLLNVTYIASIPDNDFCNQATLVEAGQIYEGYTIGATGTQVSSCSLNDTLDVWFRFTPKRHGEYTISLCGSDFDTSLSIYDNCLGSEIACNDDHYECDLQSELTIDLTANEDYLIRIAGYNQAVGHYWLIIEEECMRPDAMTAVSPENGESDIEGPYELRWNSGSSSVMAGFSDDEGNDGGDNTPSVIYGPDDRKDEYEVANVGWLTVGDSTVAIVYVNDLTDNGDGTFSLSNESFATDYANSHYYPLCTDEPYRDQPVASWCSGFLVAEDVIATAGHCVNCSNPFTDLACVFGFAMIDEMTAKVTFDASDVYYLTDVIHCQQSSNDFSLVRLDRPVIGHDPLRLRWQGEIGDEQDLMVIGHPMGLPRKYAANAEVKDNSDDDYFQANLDTYGGNSGSPVFNLDTYEVEGILIRGNLDYVSDGYCDRSYECPDGGCPKGGSVKWEDIGRITGVTDHMIEYNEVYFGEDSINLDLLGRTGLQNRYWLDELELEKGRTYYWQVYSYNACGVTVSDVFSFTTDTACSPGDINKDGKVNLYDFMALSGYWLQTGCGACDNTDLDGDENVGIGDLVQLVDFWLSCEQVDVIINQAK